MVRVLSLPDRSLESVVTFIYWLTVSYVVVNRTFSGGVGDNADAETSVSKVLEEVSTAYTRFMESVFVSVGSV